LRGKKSTNFGLPENFCGYLDKSTIGPPGKSLSDAHGHNKNGTVKSQTKALD